MQWAALAALLGQLGLAESNGSALYFSTCSHGAETWELASSPNNHEHGLVAVRSTLTGGSCLVTGASPLRTGPCNLTDDGQLFHWNATTKNALPKGVTGFVRAASGMGCPEKGGAGSEGCCITNNGEAGAVMYGCCPNGPSDCGNQIIRLYADGTLRDNRNPSDCLQHGPAPPPPPPPGPPQSTVPDPFEKLGMSDYLVYESTPFTFHAKKLLMETIALVCPEHLSNWDPQYKDCSSYYRIRDLQTGVVLRNITESCNHSFGSAFVDTDANGAETLWVVGSAWWRPALQLGEQRGGLIASRSADGWGGSCATGADCSIGSFKTSDPALKKWEQGQILAPGRSSWNVDISTGRPQSDGSKTYVLAIEQQPLAGAPAGSSWTSYFYVKDEPRSDPAYGDLTRGWRLLPTATHVIGGTGTHGACPTIRFIPDSNGGYFYVISGGLSVWLDRSRNLSHWEPSKYNGVVLQTSVNDTRIQQASSLSWEYKPRASESILLAQAAAAFSAPKPSCSWDCDASDVDLWQIDEENLLFFFLSGNQGSHIFSALGRFAGTMAEWFAAQY